MMRYMKKLGINLFNKRELYKYENVGLNILYLVTKYLISLLTKFYTNESIHIPNSDLNHLKIVNLYNSSKLVDPSPTVSN